MPNERNGPNKKDWEVCTFVDDVNLLAEPKKVMKDLLMESKKWRANAGIEWSATEGHTLATNSSDTTEKFEFDGKEINITSSTTYLRVEGPNKGVSNKQPVGRIKKE